MTRERTWDAGGVVGEYGLFQFLPNPWLLSFISSSFFSLIVSSSFSSFLWTRALVFHLFYLLFFLLAQREGDAGAWSGGWETWVRTVLVRCAAAAEWQWRG
jgi:hypothetical protein